MRDFVHLHLHTEYSLLDGFCRIKETIEKAKNLGMKSVAITDYGNMYGCVDFYIEAKKQGVKPIIGCEVHIETRDRTKNNNLILLCENMKGYKNLIKIVSYGYTENYFDKPRVKKSILEKYSEGLICISPSLKGEIGRFLLEDRYDTASETVEYYKNIYGNNSFFLELQNHSLSEQKKINPILIELSKQFDVPLVATNDVHYLDKKDSAAHDVLLCIQDGKKLSDKKRLKLPNSEFYFKSAEEMYNLFREIPEAIENTTKIADRIDFDFDFSKHYIPKFSYDENFDAKKVLYENCIKGYRELYKTDENIKRLEYELNIIDKMGFNDYFLIVQDFIMFAKESGIYVGPGRGSGGASLAAYCLGITDIDPIKHKLHFERFLNPQRITMPDFDIDFEDERRGEVIEYVRKKYGKKHVANIITFGTLGARAAIRDVGRVLDVEHKKIDQMAKTIPASNRVSLSDSLEENERLRQLLNDNKLRRVFDIAVQIEGVPRHTSTHAAGIVVSSKEITEYVPLSIQDGNITTQYNKNLIEKLGLLKIDFLGLRNLTILKNTLNYIKENKNIDLSLSDIPLDDKKTFELLQRGDSLGVFQLEGHGLRSFLRELKPDKLEDIVAGTSLYRPGPMDSIGTYLKNKENPNGIKYISEKLEPILSPTYGCLVYQEQVMQIFRDLAGYSLAGADLVRRAMSKKDMAQMMREKEIFLNGNGDDIEGCLALGINKRDAENLYDSMSEFANYAFNKTHATGYALIAYQSAYLKANYPHEYMTALMSSVMGTSNKLSSYIRNLKSMGIQLLMPNINYSYSDFKIEGESIRFGLKAIKNVGSNIIHSIIEGRKYKKYDSLDDFLTRLSGTSMNKKAIESLIKSGSLDGLGETRKSMLERFESEMDAISRNRRTNAPGQISFFDEILDMTSSKKNSEEFDEKTLLDMEKEIFGMYLSSHPIEEFSEIIKSGRAMSLHEFIELGESEEGKKCSVLAMINSVKKKKTKKGSMMAFISVSDEINTVNVNVFPKVYEIYGGMLQPGNSFVLEGRLNIRHDGINTLNLDRLFAANKYLQRTEVKKLYVKVDNWEKEEIEELTKLLRKYRGENEVVVFESSKKIARKIKDIYVDICDELLKALYELYSEERIIVK
ncbi:MAG: DNA polymerase III subunit alpha [Clostridiales bacterium]|nr:MAG: DNA polymerase III subunit alpha [Clostridiales bacterium]